MKGIVNKVIPTGMKPEIYCFPTVMYGPALSHLKITLVSARLSLAGLFYCLLTSMTTTVFTFGSATLNS